MHILNQENIINNLLFLRRAGKTYYFPAIFETFQLVSVAKKTMLLNSFPLTSRFYRPGAEREKQQIVDDIFLDWG